MLRRTVVVVLLELLVGALRRTVDDDRVDLLLELDDFDAEELIREDDFLREYVLLEEVRVFLP